FYLTFSSIVSSSSLYILSFFPAPAPSAIYTLSLHDALPIYLPVQPLLKPGRAVARNLVTMIEAEQNTVLRLGVDVHLVVRDRPLNIGVAARVEDHLQCLREESAGVV